MGIISLKIDWVMLLVLGQPQSHSKTYLKVNKTTNNPRFEPLLNHHWLQPEIVVDVDRGKLL